ncbi:hypothetical protein EX461_03395 [Vibrio parahaemolyticus]|nr:hypothetical protein [Vibrio parahaemolyticus]
MMNAARVRVLLKDLVDSTDSPIYPICDEIITYLIEHPMQQDLTVGGLRAALRKREATDNHLIQAAFTLTAHPLSALEVRYRLYDERISEATEELTHSDYMVALSNGHFIDDDGNFIELEELNRRIFPYFINRLDYNTEALK